MKRIALLVALWAAPSAAAPVRLCIVGDSISAGFSPATHGWGTELRTLIAQTPGQPQDFGVLNVAHSGDKIANAQTLYDLALAGRLRPVGAQYDGCTWVAFLIGTNDLVDGTSAATMWVGTKAMVDAARAGGTKVLLLGLLPRGTGASWSTDLGTRLLAYNALQSATAALEVPDADGRDGTASTSEAESLAPAVTRAATILDVPHAPSP